MKISLESENEWGYFIDPFSFQIVNIIDEIPEESYVVIKEREYLEDMGRTVIQTIYGVVENDKFLPMNKREITKLLSKSCADYILKHDKLPPKVMVEKELKPDKNAQLAFIMSNYDTFHLKITKDALEGGNPFEIINSILKNETFKPTMYDRDERWKLEYAKSGRSKCQTCDSNIEKGTIRIGEPYYFDTHLNYRWHHEKCVFLQRFEKEQVKGLDSLEDEDRKRIEKLLE